MEPSPVIRIGIAAFFLSAFPFQAWADGVSAGSSGTQFFGDAAGASPGQAASAQQNAPTPIPGTVDQPAGAWLVPEPKCALGGDGTCAVIATCQDGSVMMEQDHVGSGGVMDQSRTYCGSGSTTAVSVGPTPDQVYSAFKTVVPPESALEFQPAGNQTLVHFKSNYYTDAAPFDTAIDLPVGPVTFHVDFKIRPTEFDWTFGDGTTRTTSTPGAPHPHLEVTHEYQKAGTVQAHVDTVWGADYRVNGGAWAPVDGTVTKHGADVTVTVRQATPVLTD